MAQTCLAIDIGGSKLAVGLVARGGQIRAKARIPLCEPTADGVMRDVISTARSLLADNPRCAPEIIGATIPGLADPLRGVWLEASFSGIRDLPIAQLLAREFNLEAYADNDGQACALAEKLFGACRDISDFLYVTVSNGIGASIFAGNRLFLGCGAAAGELGHCVVVEGGRPCKCGNRGCLEMHAAGPAIAKNYEDIARRGNGAPRASPSAENGAPRASPPTEIARHTRDDGGRADAEEIARRAREGEPAAIAAYDLEGHYLGVMLAAACNLLNPAKVVLGGGVSQAFDLFGEKLRETLWARLYRSANQNLAVLPTAFGPDGGLLGAAAVGFCRNERLYYPFFD